MVIINLKGGLGNQLFEYASALAIAKARNQDLVFDVQSFKNDPYGRKYGLRPFEIHNKIYSEDEIKSFLHLSTLNRAFNALKSKVNKRYYSLADLELDPMILNANPIHQYLNGYFAHPSYFDNIRTELLKNIAFKDSFKTEAFNEKVEWIQQNEFISVHIRRADYISDKGANQLFETLDREYYNRCIHYFQNEVNSSKKFLFFSDDIEWVRHEFKDLERAYFIEDSELNKDYYDLMLMATCKHNIIANSTFSWWGAWLNKNENKIVLAPKVWYRNLKYQTFYEKTRFTPNTWLLK